MLAECFEVLGGVPKVVLADRMGCLKGGVVANVVVPTPDYVRFATHYGFRPDFCEAADPESKGIVENLVGYAKADLMVPLAPFDDLRGGERGGRRVVRRGQRRSHSEIAAVPVERLAVERDLLPRCRRCGPASGGSVTRKVDRLSCVRFGSARYSVPTRLIGAQVGVRTEDGRVLIIVAPTGEVVAEHTLVAPGEASIRRRALRRPTARTAAGGPARKPRPSRQFCALGPVAEAFLTGAAAAGNTRLGPELAELHTLRAAHGDDRSSRRWTGRSRSAGGEPPTSGPSWPPAPASPSPARPGTPWSSTCPRSRPARWPTTPSALPARRS